MSAEKSKSSNSFVEKSRKRARLKANIPLFFLAAPALIYLFIFSYLPMGGSIMAFQDFKPLKGFFGSKFIGLQNFEYIFSSNDMVTIIRNTIGYHVLMFAVSTLASLFVAILLYEISSRRAVKIYQTSMLLPSFISWVLVAYIVFTLLSHESGILNHVLKSFGHEPILWYSEPKYWPFILVLTSIWKGVGYSSILYYAALMGLDGGLFEAATIDGAGRLKRIWYISLPSLLPIICLMGILSAGQIMSGDMGLFYQVPRQSPALFSMTDIVNTYVTRALLTGQNSIGSAVGLFQSVVGAMLLIFTNQIIRKVSPENAMY